MNKDQETRKERELKKDEWECYLHMNRRCSKPIYIEKARTTVNKGKTLAEYKRHKEIRKWTKYPVRLILVDIPKNILKRIRDSFENI